MSQFGAGVWAVGGTAVDFRPCTSCTSGTSVIYVADDNIKTENSQDNSGSKMTKQNVVAPIV